MEHNNKGKSPIRQPKKDYFNDKSPKSFFGNGTFVAPVAQHKNNENQPDIENKQEEAELGDKNTVANLKTTDTIQNLLSNDSNNDTNARTTTDNNTESNTLQTKQNTDIYSSNTTNENRQVTNPPKTTVLPVVQEKRSGSKQENEAETEENLQSDNIEKVFDLPPIQQATAQNSILQLSEATAGGGNIRERIVAIAAAEIGKVKAKQNDGGRRIGADRLKEYFSLAAPGIWPESDIENANGKIPSWCGIFAVYTIKKAGLDIGNWQIGRGVTAFGKLTQTNSPQPGDIGYMNLNQHHCIVEKVSGDIIESIDGNSGLFSEVVRNKRNIRDYVGFFTAVSGGSGNNSNTAQQKNETASSSYTAKSAVTPLPSVNQRKQDGYVTNYPPHIVQTKPADLLQAPAQLKLAGIEHKVVQRGIFDKAASFVGGAWDATGGRVVNAAGEVIEMGEEFFWHLLEQASPDGTRVIRKIADVGIVDFLKDELKKVASKIFSRLNNNSNLLAQVAPTFKALLSRAGTIFSALQSGDCKPLFAALNQIKDVLSQLAGETWDKLTNFLKPVGEFFEELWKDFGAPVLDWVKKTAGNLWEQLKNFGNRLWQWTAPLRDTISKAWDWVMKKLGIGGGGGEGGGGEGGLIQWVQAKLEEAWELIKEQMRPLIEPAKQLVAKVKAIIPLEAILNLRKTINEWLDKAASMGDAMGADGQGIGNPQQQATLQTTVLPAVTKIVTKVQNNLTEAAAWAAGKVGELGDAVTGFIQNIGNIPLISQLTGALDWLKTTTQNIVTWAQDTIGNIADTLKKAFGRIEGFVEKVLNLLEKLQGVLSNLLDKLPDLLLGPVWWVLPDCLKEPIKKFIIEQILSRVPFFKKLMAVGDIWEKLKNAAMTMLKQVFVDGNLLGAIWTFYKTMLEILNVPPQLISNLISKGARAMKDILADPFGFLGNFLRTLKTGFLNFLSNIGTHLLNGLLHWITGQLEGTGVELPKDTSFKEIFKFVASVLGITTDYIIKKIAQHTGKDEASIRRWIERGQKGLEWLQTLLTEGPAGIWKKIQEGVDNLWNTVLDTIAGWIEQQIVQKAIAWIATKLDPTGVMAIITTIIDVMNLIESLAAQLRQILEIINGVIDGIADIAKGIIEKGAAFIERSLADGIPVALNILAGILGISGIAEKVKEAIKKLHDKIDKAIDKVVAGLKKFITGAINLGKQAVNAVLSFFGVKTHFTADNGEEHDVYYTEGDRPLLMVASTPKPIREFIAFYKDQYGLDDSDPTIAALNVELKKVDKLIKKLNSAKDADKPDIQRELLEANVPISNLLKTLLKDDKKVGKIIDSYKLEGLTGTFASMPKPTSDAMTADHQPQASALEWAAKQSYFGTTGNMVGRANNRAANGFAINLSHIRHVAGRTYGKAPADFLAKVAKNLKGKTKAQEKRDAVVDALKEELAEDVAAMRVVVTKKENWADIDAITDLDKNQKQKLKDDIKNNILAGESQLANQDMDSLRT